MKNIDIEGFSFAYVGDFFINPIRSPKKYKWSDKGVKYHDHITTCIRFIEDGLDKKEELAYIVTVNRKVVYVGEFSHSFRDRWLKTDNYIWHHKDYLIHEELSNKKKVSLWFVIDPYMERSSGVKINVSKSIEHHILKNINLKWNIRNN